MASSDQQKPLAQITDHARLCVECLDHIAALKCHQCDDQYCDLCFSQLHKSGFRSLHTFEVIDGLDIHTIHLNDFATMNAGTHEEIAPNTSAPQSIQHKSPSSSAVTQNKDRVIAVNSKDDIPDHLQPYFLFYTLFEQRMPYVPLRLSDYERKLLQILESALTISEYTDKVDVLSNGNREGVIAKQLSSIYHIISALYLSGEYKKGAKLFLHDKTYYDNRDLFTHVFEVGRRHKIRNPDKLRSSYGKIMAVAMDSKIVRGKFGFDLACPIRTVSTRCQQWGITEMLADPLLRVATCQIDLDQNISPEDLKQALEIRSNATKRLATKWSDVASSFVSSPQYSRETIGLWYDDNITSTGKISSEDILVLIQSITDSHQYLYQSLTPLQKIHRRLHQYFSPGKQVVPIDITPGRGGAVLSHSTETQYAYVNESFTIWAEVLKRIYIFWFAADKDLLGGYSTVDLATGFQNIRAVNYQLKFGDQGIIRLQSCPHVGKLMQDVLATTHKLQGGRFVGSSVVHLGDDAVPNSLAFIDKYTQIERILGPINKTITTIEAAYKDPSHSLHEYMKGYLAKLKTANDEVQLHHYILCDLFKHGFDGSGSNSRFFSGSCVDGRLSSQWEWCSKIEKKTYYQAFLITGFVGFN